MRNYTTRYVSQVVKSQCVKLEIWGSDTSSETFCSHYLSYIIIIVIRVLCPRAGLSLQNAGIKVAVLLKGRSYAASSVTKVAILLGINWYGSFQFLSAPHSLFSIWKDLKGYEKIPGALAWRWGEWIWLTRPSGLHRNSPQRLHISSITVFDHIWDLGIPIAFGLRISISDPVVQAVKMLVFHLWDPDFAPWYPHVGLVVDETEFW